MQSVKKINCFILSFVLLLVSLFTTTQVNAETVKIGLINEPGTNKIGVVLRSDAYKPSKSDENKIITLWTGDSLTILDSKQDITGKINPDTNKVYIWYRGSIAKNGVTYTGYIREDMIVITEHIVDPTFEQQLAEFPESYRADLIKLHAIYPNWVFKADKINLTFAQAVALEDVDNRKLVQGSDFSLRSMRKGCYDWNTGSWVAHDNGTWYGASRELIAYYMDPRNFLNANDIYVYMIQTEDSNNSSVSDMEKVLSGTFLLNKYDDPNDTAFGNSYVNVIFEASKQAVINPFVLASTIRIEQGTQGTSALISGNKFTYLNEVYEGLYNFFNFGSTGSNKELVIRNGLLYAKNSGWTTRSKSIIDGAKLYRTKYIDVGQNTYFYKNYNIIGSANASHQYAQNVADSHSSAKTLSKVYSEHKDKALTFRIPVYKDNSLPTQISPYPQVSDKLNNYYFKNIQASGLTPSYTRFTYEYSMTVNGDSNIYIELLDGTEFVSASTHNLNKGDNVVNLTVKSQTGFTNTYKVNIHATTACKLTISTNAPPLLRGDANNDGSIKTSDLAAIRLHILNLVIINDEKKLYGADANNDNKISAADLAAVRLHLLGIKLLNN